MLYDTAAAATFGATDVAATRRQLYGLSNAELRDIGMEPGQIDDVARAMLGAAGKFGPFAAALGLLRRSV